MAARKSTKKTAGKARKQSGGKTQKKSASKKSPGNGGGYTGPFRAAKNLIDKFRGGGFSGPLTTGLE